MSGSVNKVIIIGQARRQPFEVNARSQALAGEARRLYEDEQLSVPQIAARLVLMEQVMSRAEHTSLHRRGEAA